MNEQLSNKKVKWPAINPTKRNMCRLNGHNCLWRDCPNNPNFKKYNGTRYSKIREQEWDGRPGKNKDTDTKSYKEQSEPKGHRKRHHHKSCDDINSINFTSNYAISTVRCPQVRNSLKNVLRIWRELPSRANIFKYNYIYIWWMKLLNPTYRTLILSSTHSTCKKYGQAERQQDFFHKSHKLWGGGDILGWPSIFILNFID